MRFILTPKTLLGRQAALRISFRRHDIRSGPASDACRSASSYLCLRTRPAISAGVHYSPRCSISEAETPLSKHHQLALAISQGKSIAVWARQNDVPRHTAYDWANKPEVRRLVEDCRRRCIDRALGSMATHSMRAVKAITKLGETAESESVQLKAWRAVLFDQLAIAKQANLEYRMAQIEEKQRARTGNPNSQL